MSLTRPTSPVRLDSSSPVRPGSCSSVRPGSCSSVRPGSSYSTCSDSSSDSSFAEGFEDSHGKFTISIASAHGARTVTWERVSNRTSDNECDYTSDDERENTSDDERDYTIDTDLVSKDLASAIEHMHTLMQQPNGTAAAIGRFKNTYYLPPKPTDTTTCSSAYGSSLPPDLAPLLPSMKFTTYMVELNLPKTEHVRNMLLELSAKFTRGAPLEYSEDDLAQVSHLFLNQIRKRSHTQVKRRKPDVYCIMLEFAGDDECAKDAILTAIQSFRNGKKLAFTSEQLQHVNFVQHCPPYNPRGNRQHNSKAHPVTFTKSYGPKHPSWRWCNCCEDCKFNSLLGCIWCVEEDRDECQCVCNCCSSCRGCEPTARHPDGLAPYRCIFGLRFHRFQERQFAALLNQHVQRLEEEHFFDFYKGNKKVAQDTSETVAVQALEEVQKEHPIATIWDRARNSLQSVVPFLHPNASLNHNPGGLVLIEGQASNNISDNAFMIPDKFKEVAAKSHQAKVRFEQAEERRREQAAQDQQKLLRYDDMLGKLSAESPSPERNQKFTQLEAEYTNFLSHIL
ncbi:hypothetical protein FB567DRAFT_555828 [Paraphoma chrysanthemicola]|uniref:Uncharacterized protein n=1 Tax=Paraphoma chrysanthemicola TaxID=798071 RepID=A0A8K0QT80_9PLEO|nr:hypothetical protein FB567DRAFT_555828 [Paraphoma chrysanthemicola]